VQPERTSELVEPLFKWLKLDEPARAFRALRAFSRAAGPRIRAIARAERLRSGTLYVRVQTAAWSQELTVLKSALVEKLKRTPGGEAIEDVRFHVGPLDELPNWEEIEAPKSSVARADAKPARDVQLEELRKTIEQVSDPELRAELSLLCAKLQRPLP
jgi:hypothetical protein